MGTDILSRTRISRSLEALCKSLSSKQTTWGCRHICPHLDTAKTVIILSTKGPVEGGLSLNPTTESWCTCPLPCWLLRSETNIFCLSSLPLPRLATELTSCQVNQGQSNQVTYTCLGYRNLALTSEHRKITDEDNYCVNWGVL